MKIKKIIAWILTGIMVLSLAGCGKSESAETKTEQNEEQTEAQSVDQAEEQTEAQADTQETEGGRKAVFVSLMSGGVVWSAAERGFTDACNELGWEGQFVAPLEVNSLSQMLELAESAVTNDADALVGPMIDGDVFEDVFKRAKDQGMAIVTTNCTPNDQIDCWVGTAQVALGEKQAETLVEIAGDDPINVVYIQTALTLTSANNVFNAFSEKLKELRPDATIISQEENNSDASKTSDKLSALIKSYPEINCVVCYDGYAPVGVGALVTELNLQDKLHVVGVDDDPQTLKYVKDGVIDCTIAQDFYTMGYECVMLANKVLNGEEVSFDNDSGTILITKDDVDSYSAERGIELPQ